MPEQSEPASRPGPDPNSPPASSPISAPATSRFPTSWVVAVLGLVAVVLLARPVMRSLTPAPRLDHALRLISEGKYPEAEAKLRDFLSRQPSSVRGRLTMADILVSREDPKPNEALKILDGLRLAMPSDRAYALVLRGKAEKLLSHPGKAEANWVEALRLDPRVGEAGWLLLELYYTENRVDESRRLALRLSRTEPDSRDRVRLLLEPIRFDAKPLAAAGVIPLFKDAVANDPNDRHAALAYYGARARDGVEIEQAIAALRGLVQRFPEDLACWEGFLETLNRTGDLESMQAALESMPKSLASEAKIARYRGRLAMSKKDYTGAIKAFEASLAAGAPDHELFYRLSEAYKLAGKTAEAEATKAREAEMEAARMELRGINGPDEEEGRPGLFNEASSRPNLGLVADPALYKRLASVRERMGHPDEAKAWYELVLRDFPDDPESLAAISRLGSVASP